MQLEQRKEVLNQLPTFAAETVDSIRALAQALATASDKRDGEAVVRQLRSLKFNGVSGYVEFTPEGDRKNPQFSMFNAQNKFQNGKIAWTDIGSTGTEVGSASLAMGVSGVCFAEAGCGLASPPEDTYPFPPSKIPAWGIVLIVCIPILTLLLVYFRLRYWRSRRSKKNIRAELEAFRDSVVGMRAADCNYIPKVTKNNGDIEEGTAATGTTKWMWKETAFAMANHNANDIYDANECWILYTADCSKKLEEAYKKGKKEFSPLPGYKVDFATMKQIKQKTGFQRDVQRVFVGAASTKDNGTTATIDMSKVEVGDKLPDDVAGEPQMVLCEGDVVQISKQRPDGWAFGTKVCVLFVCGRCMSVPFEA
jgi:hypothetical protein